MFYNEERLNKQRPLCFLAALLTHGFCLLYRVVIAAVLFAVAPFYATLICLCIYLAGVVLFKCCAVESTWEAVLFCYVALFSPSGHTKNSPGTTAAGTRARRFSYAGKGQKLRSTRSQF